jgi:hypothetical protein
VTLDIFTQKLGDTKMPRLDGDNTGLVAVQMLDAIQTVVDVLTDNDGGKGWTVGFDPTVNAYTDRSAKRNIVVSVKPLLDAKPGDRLDRVAAIMTGFAVHEVGHTKLNFATAISARWPGKRLPQTLGNIIEDVVLEMRTVERFPGFADHGEGNVFRPTLEWVADQTCPKTPLKWSGSTGHKVNVTGQIIRYRDFVTFSPDAVTQSHLRWIEQWATNITPALGPSGCVTLIEQWLDHVKATLTDDIPEPEVPLPPGTGKGEPGEGKGEAKDDTEGENPDGDGDGQGVPDEDDDDDDTEGDDGGGDSDGDDGQGEGNGEAEDGDGGDSGSDDSDDSDTEGDGDEGQGKGNGEGRRGDGNDADHGNRTEAPKGTNDGPGKGGSGQSISEAGDEDPDDGFDEADLDESFDKVSSPEGKTYEQNTIARAEADERVTTRLDAGAHGKMRVIFR